jgi:hypothetical protein
MKIFFAKFVKFFRMSKDKIRPRKMNFAESDDSDLGMERFLLHVLLNMLC